jgi:two-component system NtrC family sensor kinase
MDDREGVHRMIENIGNQPGVELVRIFNKEGKIMFSTNKGEMNNYVDKKAEACYICHAAESPLERLSTLERSRIFPGKNHRILAVITPIYNEPDCYNASCHAHPREQRVLGVLDIGMSLVDVDSELKRNQVLSISFTLIAILCISSILTLFIHRLITKPVKQLVSGTRKIAQGDLEVEIPVKAGDEIGQLAVSFNHMIRDLKKADEKIHAWNIELEKKVEERTEKLRMTRDRLIQSEKMASMGVLASSMAHEINNPMQGILNYIKLMLKILSGAEVDQKRLAEFKNYLQLMENEIEQCSNMVKNFLVFSDQTRLNIQEAHINDIINTCLQLVENKIKLHHIEVMLNLQEDIPGIYCDIKQIRQTLAAVIVNSMEAMPGGGTLRIESRGLPDRQVEILVADTGKGIPKENLGNIFYPFFTTKESVKSTGLSLFVSYGIIKEHKGTIEVKSEVGKGTTFHIKLPAKEG